MQFEGYAYVWSELLLTLQSMLLMQATSFAKVIIQSHRGMENRNFKALFRRNYNCVVVFCGFFFFSPLWDQTSYLDIIS